MCSVRSRARGWRTYVAFGGLSLIQCSIVADGSELPLHSVSQAQQHSTPGAENSHFFPVNSGCSPLKLVSTPTKMISVQACPTDNGKDLAAADDGIERNLKASQDKWTLIWLAVTAIFTGLLFFATFGLWIFTALLWNSTRRAVRDGQAAVVAAQRSANAAEKATHVERAWMIQDDKKLGRSSISLKNGINLGPCATVAIVWRNSGRTPAIKAAMIIDIKVTDYKNDHPPKFTKQVSFRYSAVIGQQRTSTTNLDYITERDIHQIHALEKRAYIYSRVDYLDVYNPHIIRTTEFCAEILPQRSFRNGDFEFALSPVGEQNRCT